MSRQHFPYCTLTSDEASATSVLLLTGVSKLTSTHNWHCVIITVRSVGIKRHCVAMTVWSVGTKRHCVAMTVWSVGIKWHCVAMTVISWYQLALCSRYLNFSVNILDGRAYVSIGFDTCFPNVATIVDIFMEYFCYINYIKIGLCIS
jgi:hypothetical protein